MLNAELRWKYLPLKISAFVLGTTWGTRLINMFGDLYRGSNTAGMKCDEAFIPSNQGGPNIRVRIFKPLHSDGPLPGMLYIHGGGYTVGSPDLFLDLTKRFITAEPCVIVTPHYRRALDAPYPAAFDDCYDTLLWMRDHSTSLGIIPDAFIVAGHSAGGGLTAAVSLKATDTRDVHIAFQMPIYPMIDDRMETESAKDNHAPVWDSRANSYAWGQYLRGLRERKAEIPSYAAAARATDYSKLPPTITFVSGLEPFRDEVTHYVAHLREAGVPVEFRLFEGCFHAFEVLVPKAKISKEAWAFVFDGFSKYMNKYVHRR